MKKLFIQLIAEFKRLGAIVVHADFNRVRNLEHIAAKKLRWHQGPLLKYWHIHVISSSLTLSCLY